MTVSIPAASSKMRRSEPPAAASIRPTGGLALAMRRQRDGAAIERVDQRRVAQRAQVLGGERLVVGESRQWSAAGSPWSAAPAHRRARSAASVRAMKERRAIEQVDVVGGRGTPRRAGCAPRPAGRRCRPCWRAGSDARHSSRPRRSRPWPFITPTSRNSGTSIRSISAPARDSAASARSKVFATASSRSSSATVVGTASRMPFTGRGASGSHRLVGQHRVEHGAAGHRIGQRAVAVRA